MTERAGVARANICLSKQAGVTLIELMIAVTLVGLLAVGMLMAMHAGLNAMDRSTARLMGNRRVMSVDRILEAEIGNIIPVKAECGEAPAAPKISFFEGEGAAMRFVSAFSLAEASRGVPMVLEYAVIPGENGVGVRLVVNEHPYTGPKGAGAFCAGVAPDETGAMAPQFYPIQFGPASFVIADKLAYCRFSYRLLLPETPGQPPPLPRWVTHWTKPFLPSAIQVEMGPLEPDPAGVHLGTSIIPVHITRDPLSTYVFP